MKTWYAANLGDAMLAGDREAEIRSLFESAYERAGKPDDMALFIRHESGDLHCRVRIFFTPAAAGIAAAAGALACPRPAAEGLDLLAGSRHAWPVYFPERG